MIADGHHARVDGWTSLAVLASAVGAWLGYPLLDPIVGLLITAAIGRIVWQSAVSVFTRMLDGVDPEIVDNTRHGVAHGVGVEKVSEVRARWLGHRLHAEVNVAVQPDLSVSQGHAVAIEARHQLLHRLPYIENAIITSTRCALQAKTTIVLRTTHTMGSRHIRNCRRLPRWNAKSPNSYEAPFCQ